MKNEKNPCSKGNTINSQNGKDSFLQERRELTFWLQETAYCLHAPLFSILSFDDMPIFKKKQILSNLGENMRSAIIAGTPITDPWQRAEHIVGGFTMDSAMTQAEKKTELLLFELADRLDLLGFNNVTTQLPLTPYNHPDIEILEFAGIGYIGKNNLPQVNEFGCRVNLGIIFTNAPLNSSNNAIGPSSHYSCENCNLCVEHCPCGALSDGFFDEEKCVNFRNAQENQLHYSPYTVLKCDICMRICPNGTLGKWDSSIVSWEEILKTRRINF